MKKEFEEQINSVNIIRKDESCRAGRYLEMIQSYSLVADFFSHEEVEAQ